MKKINTEKLDRNGRCYGYESHPTHYLTAEGTDVVSNYWNAADMREEERAEYSSYMDICFEDGTNFYRTGIDSLEVAVAVFGAALDIIERLADASTAQQVAALKAIGFEVV